MPLQIDRVVQMKQQGLTNNQILEALQREGFKTDEIFDAMKQADIKIQFLQGPVPAFQAPPTTFSQQGPVIQPSISQREEIEEVAEAIIEEKWQDIAAEIRKIADWRDTVERRLAQLEAQTLSLKDNFDKLHSALLEKIDEYDRHISEVGIDIKALEKVFQKILPTFTQNVNELSRVAQDLKSIKK